jgi:lysophospholipase L1-like esterase
VRLELVGDADAVEIAYRAQPGEGVFQLWVGDSLVSEEKAEPGEGTVRLAYGGGGRAIVYLPESMKPEILSLDGPVGPAPRQPMWAAYGDSILEGWTASAPALGWGARAGRAAGLDLVNMGYAGSARGELASAEHLASRKADVLTICHGTNCWTVVPHTPATMRAGLTAFLDTVRASHPETPLVVLSPVLRPDAEDTPNRLGATLADLRATMEEVYEERGDERLTLVRGRHLVTEDQLADGIHPDDDGHAAIAAAAVPALQGAI